jgi:hypothetical protein
MGFVGKRSKGPGRKAPVGKCNGYPPRDTVIRPTVFKWLEGPLGVAGCKKTNFGSSNVTRASSAIFTV